MREDKILAAKEHIAEMDELFMNETYRSARYARPFYNSIFNDDAVWNKLKADAKRPEVIFAGMGAVETLFEYGQGRSAVLDFADFLRPAGSFLEGKDTQETDLCRHSNLYNILLLCTDYYENNKERTFGGLYKDRCLIVPEVIFEKDGKEMNADVIVSSMPDVHAFRKSYYHGINAGDNNERFFGDFQEVLDYNVELRTAFLRRVVDVADIDTLILGAWGCGESGNDPVLTASMLDANIYKTNGSYMPCLKNRRQIIKPLRRCFHKFIAYLIEIC